MRRCVKLPVYDFVNTGVGTFSKIWTSLRSKSKILKTWGEGEAISPHKCRFLSCFENKTQDFMLYLFVLDYRNYKTLSKDEERTRQAGQLQNVCNWAVPRSNKLIQTDTIHIF